jgi:signal transduction histidine kinase
MRAIADLLIRPRVSGVSGIWSETTSLSAKSASSGRKAPIASGFGPRAVFATIEAVETFVDRHYAVEVVLIDALLQLSRSSFRDLCYAEIDLNQVVSKAFQELKVYYFNSETTLKVDSSLGRVYGDLRQVETLIRNLLSSSIKFGKPKRASLNIEVWASTLTRGNASFKEIHIRDNGVGFDVADYERLIQPFADSNEASDDVKDESELPFLRGVGLGLAVCSRILENHKGHFQVTSQIGVGSEFILSFPLLSPEVLTATQAPRSGELLY